MPDRNPPRAALSWGHTPGRNRLQRPSGSVGFLTRLTGVEIDILVAHGSQDTLQDLGSAWGVWSGVRVVHGSAMSVSLQTTTHGFGVEDWLLRLCAKPAIARLKMASDQYNRERGRFQCVCVYVYIYVYIYIYRFLAAPICFKL